MIALNLSHIAQQAEAVINQTADFLFNEFLQFKTESIEYKGLNDLVSYVDRETEKLLIQGLSTILPEAQFITEEGTISKFDGQAPTQGAYWIIDPLDGTTNFIHGIPIFGISVGLMVDGEMLIGIINEPNRKESFLAIKGGGAFCNGKPIQVSQKQTVAESLLATGFPYQQFEYIDAYLTIIHRFMQESHGLRRMGSASIDLAWVACGRFEGFFEYNLKPWDVAAGVLIVEEAGGKCLDFSGGKDYIFGKQIIAASQPVAEEMKSLIQSYWPA